MDGVKVNQSDGALSSDLKDAMLVVTIGAWSFVVYVRSSLGYRGKIIIIRNNKAHQLSEIDAKQRDGSILRREVLRHGLEEGCPPWR